MPHPLLLSLLTLPKGKVTSYKALAQKFAMHPRVVARVLAGNREQDVYPCYKVVHSDGKIGGYNLGAEEKIRRLKRDGIQIYFSGKDHAPRCYHEQIMETLG